MYVCVCVRTCGVVIVRSHHNSVVWVSVFILFYIWLKLHDESRAKEERCCVIYSITVIATVSSL